MAEVRRDLSELFHVRSELPLRAVSLLENRSCSDGKLQHKFPYFPDVFLQQRERQKGKLIYAET